ncbi:helix-turn-helix domain-containing protein [Aquimarina litoralis]|uniref:helix-turn-helix domain-containing protein n=1 Tax=Aquimarina litoralis TaxID=584605 RepID=UPI001C58980C|nr:helix-turn-helix domain-containing protein [Aquimarina litoralis]MBW1294973.1 helix-turn-helix domain-containing protein [Aquimarina litoralis]
MKLAVDFILIIGILLNIIALIGLFRLKQKKLPQYILIVFWLLILSIFIFFYANLHDLRIVRFIANYFQGGARFIIPPLLFLYVKSIFSNKPDLLKKNLIHFVPFLIYFTFYTVPNSLDFEFTRWIDAYINRALIKDIYGIVYFSLSIKLFYVVNKTMKHNYSNIKEKDFLWIRNFLICFLLVLIIDLLLTISEISFGYNVSWDGYITVFFIIVAMSYLGYYGVTQSKIFLPDFLIQEHITKSTELEYKTSYLKDDEKDALKQKFYKCMNEEKLYLLPDLNLKMIANSMEVSERKLSAFFGEVLDSNFYDSINLFRVEEAKTILKSDAVESHSITGIGLSCGFSSKSSFYRIFKNKTGVSPSVYRTLALKESHST